jgi:hypothetical protein
LLPVIGVENHVLVAEVAALAGEELREDKMSFVAVAKRVKLKLDGTFQSIFIFLHIFVSISNDENPRETCMGMNVDDEVESVTV